MKKIILFITTLLILSVPSIIYAQPLVLETTDVNHRFMLKLNYPSNSTQSSAGIQIKSGTFANESNAELACWSNTYTASPGYKGYAGVTNQLNGLILRASGATGEIKFLTGGGVIASNTRMLIDNTGNVGIGTSSPASKLQLETGDVYVKGLGSGVIIKSPNGSCYRLTVSNTGIVGSQSVTCPL